VLGRTTLTERRFALPLGMLSVMLTTAGASALVCRLVPTINPNRGAGGNVAQSNTRYRADRCAIARALELILASTCLSAQSVGLTKKSDSSARIG
jgi:hypothetical protein